LTGIMRWFATRRERARAEEPAPSREAKASGPIERFWERAEVLGLWAAAGVGLIAILVSNNDAKEQLVALRAQLGAMLSAQRAWLQVTVIPSSLQFDSEGAAVLAYKYRVKNVGRSVAENVEIYANAFVVDGGMKSRTMERQVAECDAIAKKRETSADKSLGIHLFPDESYPSDEESAQGFTTLSSAEIERGARMIASSSRKPSSNSLSNRPFELNLIGCVNYRLSAGADYHQTGFVFDVYKVAANGELPSRLVDGEDVLYPQLRFERSFGDGVIN
jgi:hypothetical protein